MPAALQAQVTIGDLDGAANNSYLPMNSLYNYSYTQQIYTAEEIGMAGTINSITIWMYGNANLYEMPFTIYMVETEKNAFASTSDWESVTASDIVYTGSVTVHNTAAEPFVFELSTPFVYSGQGNLLIAFNNTTGQWKSGLNGKVFGASGDPVRAIYARQDGSAYDPYTPTFTAYGTTYQRNVIEMAITPAGGVTCDKPTAIEVSDVTTNSAFVHWGGGSGSYNLQWKLASEEWVEDDFVTVNYDTSYFITGLQHSSNYNVRVRSVCGDITSGWRSTNFTTACDAITNFPWTEDFESYATGNFEDPCWVNEHIEGSGTYLFKVYSSTSGMSGNTTKMLQLPDMSGGTMTMLRLPVMNLPENYEFQIDVLRSNSTYNTNNIYEGVRVYVSTDGEIEGATELAFIPRQYNTGNDVIPAESEMGWYTYELPIGMSGTCYIILRGESQYCTATYMDNFAVKALPTCFKPTGLAYSDVTAHTVALSWTSDAEAWQICLNDDEENLIPVTENPYTLENLLESTAYTVKVRTNCGNDGVSDWSNVVSFTTPIACPAPTGVSVNDVAADHVTLNWTGNAEGYNVMYRTAAYAEGIYEEFNNSGIPSGWKRYSGLVDYVLTDSIQLSTVSGYWNTNTNALGQYNMKLNIYGTSCRYWLVTPEFTLDQNLSFDLALTAYNSANPIANDTLQADDRFIVLLYANDAWTILREWNNRGSEYVYNAISATGENVTLDLSQYYGQDVMIAFYGESTNPSGMANTGGDNDLHIDNVYCGTPYPAGEWQTVVADTAPYVLTNLVPETDYEAKVESACEGEQGHETSIVKFTTKDACEIPTNLAANEITSNSAVLSWNENGLADSWYIEYTAVAADLPAPVQNMIEVTENPYTLTGLNPEMTYEVRVISSCAVEEGDPMNNMWSSTITFATLPTCPAPINVVVSDITGHEVTVSWTEIGSATQWYLYGSEGSDEIDVMVYNDTTYTFTDLTPETEYYFDLYAICGEDEESQPTQFVFTTGVACPAPTDLTVTNHTDGVTIGWNGESDSYNVKYRTAEYVDGVEEGFGTSIPSGWSMYTGLLTDGTATMTSNSYAWSFGSGNGVFDNHAKVNIYGNYQRWLVMPEVTVPENAGLSFDLALTAWSGTSVPAPATTGTDDKFMVLISTDNMATWNTLREWNNEEGAEYVYNDIANTATGENVSIDVRDYVGQTVRIAFYGESTESNADNNLHIDNVTFGTYHAPGDWQEVSTTTNSVDIELSEADYYEVQVQGDCGEEDGLSSWSEPLFFEFAPSTCGIVLNLQNNSWVEDFEDITTIMNPRWTFVTPDCWTVVEKYTFSDDIDTLPQVYRGFNTTEDGKYSLRMHFRSLLAMPELDENVDLGKVRLSMNVRQPYWSYKLQIGVITDIEDPDSFVPVAVVNNSNKSMTHFECGFATVKDLTGPGRHIAFKNIGGSANDPYCTNYMDDVTLSYVDELECEITLPYTENFEDFTNATGATGIEPSCWEVVANDVMLESGSKPQLYRGFNADDSGYYTLRMMNRCVYALPVISPNYAIDNMTMTLSVRQPNSLYRLQVGVWNEIAKEFTPVKTIKCNGTTMETFTVDFSSYDGEGTRIAFRNTLVPGTGMSVDYLDYSYNYIDNINLDDVMLNDEERSNNNTEAMSDVLDNIEVYPNPTTGNLYIDAVGIQKVECYNAMGQLVRVYDNVVNSIDMNNLSEGVYTLRITVPQGMTMRKVVKR